MPSHLEFANAIANRPEVLPSVAFGYDAIDLAPFFAKPDNIAVGDDKGMALFAHAGGGVYEGHYLFPPETREKSRYCSLFIAWLFTFYPATAIVGHVPAENLKARAMSRALGFTPTGTSVSSTGRSCVDYCLERAQWAILSVESSGA